MSAFIVGDETIDRVLFAVVPKLGADFVPTPEHMTRLGRFLLQMNVDAFNACYQGRHDPDCDPTTYTYTMPAEDTHPAQLYKSLQCFVYQCTEHPVTDRRAYQELKDVMLELAALYHNTPEYEAAEWG